MKSLKNLLIPELKVASNSDITANDILLHLGEMYSDANQYVCAAEVSPRTGAWERRIDFLVMNCYDSEQLKIQGYEIKISKADLKRELEDPDKHAVFFDAIDFYWLIAPKQIVDNIDLIPPKWGVRAVWRDESGKLISRTVRKPTCLHDEQMYSRKIRKTFMASFCRAISKQSLTKAKLHEQQRGLEDEIRKKLEQEIAGGARIVPDWKLESLERCKRLVSDLGLNEYSDESSRKHIRKAVDIVSSLDMCGISLRDAKNRINEAIGIIKGLEEEKAEDGKVQGDDQHFIGKEKDDYQNRKEA